MKRRNGYLCHRLLLFLWRRKEMEGFQFAIEAGRTECHSTGWIRWVISGGKMAFTMRELPISIVMALRALASENVIKRRKKKEVIFFLSIPLF
jgi:hypothetical protein